MRHAKDQKEILYAIDEKDVLHPPGAERLLVTVGEGGMVIERTRTRANCLEGNYPTVGPRMLNDGY
jgi:hypothetical protein